jgi:hypothetical protein
MEWRFDPSSERKVYNSFIVSITLGIALCLSGIFLGIAISVLSIELWCGAVGRLGHEYVDTKSTKRHEARQET